LPATSSRLSLALALAALPVAAQTFEELATQRAAYDEVRAKTILELQPFRHEVHALMPDGETPLHFVSLNPGINAWFLVEIGEGRGRRSYHLENPDAEGQSLALVTGPALLLSGPAGEARCAPWAAEAPELDRARESGLPYAPICEGRLYLRNPVTGSRTSLERTTDFLRDYVWGGEEVVRFVRDNFFRDLALETSDTLGTGGTAAEAGPPPAPLRVPDEERPVISTLHDFELDGTDPGRMTVGAWHPVTGLEGIFVSAIQPRQIAEEILDGPGRTNPLDSVERGATDYMVAFDLSRFELGFALGTDHPRLDWSPRPPASVRPRGLPGPDGVGAPDPLIPLGMVSPALAGRTVASFTAGFKRQHGAFRRGPFSTINHGSHYGFIEQGVIFSKLQPGLSTLYVLDDGTIEMKSWTEEDDALLPRIRFARQNGVPLVEPHPETGERVPGELVTAWGPGNWSGSAKAELRTLRAGGCIVETEATRYLVYGYFTAATPSAMARTFLAYGCSYAMLLDMNALEHTYLALYVRGETEVHVEHLQPGMALIDRKDRQGKVIPRFLGYPDNRDLFYLMRKEDAP
jgi:hypothetical protein